MITIHHHPGTRGLRVIWLCEELSLPYELRKVDFSAAYRESPEWRRMNPVGKVPVMEDGGFRMFESGAMMQYLLARYGDGRLEPPHDGTDYGTWLQWCWFAEATFGRATGEIANHKRAFAGALKADAIEEMRGRARACMHALEQALDDGRPHLMGEPFTAADIMMGYTLQSFGRHLPDDVPPPNAGAYQERIEGRPACRAAMAAEQALRESP